jgi:hypothetical protein
VGIPLVIAELTGEYQRNLRRFTWGSARDGGNTCPGRSTATWQAGHDAFTVIGNVPESESKLVHGDNWTHDDHRWPEQCAHCGYRFADTDEWQRNDNALYRRPDGVEFVLWGDISQVPAGTMCRLPWADHYMSVRHPQHVESWRIQLPDGGEWVTSQAASGGGFWTVNGTPPMIDVTPSIWHSQPSGWHGFIRNGELIPA